MTKSTRDEELMHSASATLLEHGQLDAQWLSDFNGLLRDGREGPPATWKPAYFRVVRFASLYLPIRYGVWLLRSNEPNLETQDRLAEIGREAEVTLWVRVLDDVATEQEDDVRLTDHVFQAVEGLCTGGLSLSEWERTYCRLLDAISARWQTSEWWSRRACMAVHFASFYLDIGLTQELPKADRTRVSPQEEQMLQRLASITSSMTCDIVRAWIANTAAVRDGSGTPLLGSPKAGARRTKVRTPSEVLLMRPRPLDMS